MSRLFWGELAPSAEFAAVIMAGGSGTRFWPMSRRARPKQVLPLSPDGRTLIAATADRLNHLKYRGCTLIVTAMNQRALVSEQVPQAALLAEPLPRNTAPCIGYAALKILDSVGDIPMLCLPADHLIQNVDALAQVYEAAIALTQQSDVLVTIGIQPTFPETGYGYILAGKGHISPPDASLPAFPVEAFVEKPDLTTAEQYLRSGRYFWNSGMFAWRPSVILSAIAEFMPELHQHLLQIRALFGREDEAERIEEVFRQITPVQIDYGIMEKARNVAMLPGAGLQWNDVGSWRSWADCVVEAEHPENGNVLRGDVLTVGCRDSAVISSGKLIAAVGLEGIVVVETGDAILVCKRELAQDVKKVVDTLKEKGRTQLL